MIGVVVGGGVDNAVKASRRLKPQRLMEPRHARGQNSFNVF